MLLLSTASVPTELLICDYLAGIWISYYTPSIIPEEEREEMTSNFICEKGKLDKCRSSIRAMSAKT